MVSDIALLGFLDTEKLHGYEIYQRFGNLPGLWEVWRIKQSRLYAMLARLETKGLIKADMLYQENRPARKVFSMTASGQSVYQDWIVSPVESARQFRLEFMVKLFFAVQAGANLREQLINRQLEICQHWLENEKQALDALGAVQPFEESIHQFRIGQISAMLSWLSSIQGKDFTETIDDQISTPGA